MSHLFISFAHADATHRETLVTWLRENGLAEHEIWYDHQIEGGSNWRDEITTALNEAFAILVLVTSNSVKSLYCTYEWAYAMGQGIPLLPLVFDEVSMADVPAPLAAKQFIPCRENIPDYLKARVRQFRSTPPHIAEINKAIYEAIFDTHRRLFVLCWTDDEIVALDHEFKKRVVAYFIEGATTSQRLLKGLMVDKSSVMSTRQFRQCWQLIDLLQQFVHLDDTYDRSFKDDFSAMFETVWLL